eukprot:5423631-Alexandrium_andersonii.AAC.1
MDRGWGGTMKQFGTLVCGQDGTSEQGGQSEQGGGRGGNVEKVDKGVGNDGTTEKWIRAVGKLKRLIKRH